MILMMIMMRRLINRIIAVTDLLHRGKPHMVALPALGFPSRIRLQLAAHPEIIPTTIAATGNLQPLVEPTTVEMPWRGPITSSLWLAAHRILGQCQPNRNLKANITAMADTQIWKLLKRQQHTTFCLYKTSSQIIQP
jgi:hypothetical protein